MAHTEVLGIEMLAAETRIESVVVAE